MRSRYCCLAETWIPNKEEASNFSIEGFNLTDVSAGPGKGCCAYIRDNENCNSFSHINNEYLQALSFKIDGEGIQLTIVYLKSGAPLSEAKLCIQWLFQQLPLPVKQHMIVGDFNLDAKQSNAITSLFTEELGLKQLVERPTHREGRTIDHCYISPSCCCCSVYFAFLLIEQFVNRP